MTDNLEDKGPADGKLISLRQPYEVRYWAKALNLTEDELRTVVAEVGHSAEAVRAAILKAEGGE